MHERAALTTLLDTLDGSPRALGRDQTGEWLIRGKKGHIQVDGKGFAIVVGGEAPRHLDRPPTTAEAALIRDALGIKRKPGRSHRGRLQ